jgi:alanyl-tRNA synthetase
MMGDTGPCGPCSEIHVNLTPDDDEAAGPQARQRRRRPLHRDLEPRLHPVQRQPDGTFSPLAAKHVDTGMGFERVAGICATTKGFKDFCQGAVQLRRRHLRALFERISPRLSGRAYGRHGAGRRSG